MAYRDTVDSPPPDPRLLEKTTNSRSPEEINEDISQTQNTYHFQNCGTVYMTVDSFNAGGVRIENCGNNIPQVNCSNVIHSQSHAVSSDLWHSAHPRLKNLNIYFLL